jgi:hypothetical protein
MNFDRANETNDKKMLEKWEKTECSPNITNGDVVEKFYLILNEVIQSKKLGNKTEGFVLHEIISKINVKSKLSRIFFELR